MRRRVRFLLALVALALPGELIPLGGANAAMPPSDKPILVSITQATECDQELGCAPPLVDRPIPTFLRIDLKKKLVTIIAPMERKGETTVIEFVEQLEDRVILAGAESQRAWSLLLNQDGTMTLSLSDVKVGFVVFGNWMLAEDVAR